MREAKWAGRFIAGAIVNGAFGFGVMAVLLYLAVLGRPAASRIVASGGAGTWFVVGMIAYGLVGILGIAVSALFYQYLEGTLEAPYSGWRNLTAWAHLLLGGIGGTAATLLTAYGGYQAGAALLPSDPPVYGGGQTSLWVHVNVLSPLSVPIAALLGVTLLGYFIGGVGYVTAWWAARKNA